MNPAVSKLQFYSIGIVAANKLLSSHVIEVVPMESTSMVDGELTDNVEQYKAKGQSPEGESFDVDMKTTASVKATWLSYSDTNRITSPDVRRGEIVSIYQFSDTDQYWWVTLQQDKKLRRLETVIYSFSNQSKENLIVDSSSSYWVEFSTHKKLIHVHTSKNDGEPFIYDLQINAKEGCVTLKDDDGNYFFMDSKERHIKLRNKDDSFLDMNKRKIHINAIDEVLITTKAFEVRASNTIKMTTRDYTLRTGSYKTYASSSYNTYTSVANFSTNIKAGVNINAGVNIHAGAVSSAGSLLSAPFISAMHI